MTDIKPCPKCGGQAKLISNRALGTWGYFVGCLDCSERTAMYGTSEKAIASWNEKTTPSTDVSSDRKINAQPIFCCGGMAYLFASGEINLQRLDQSGGLIATIGRFDRYVPINYCPSCGRLFRLTFLADSEVDE